MTRETTKTQPKHRSTPAKTPTSRVWRAIATTLSVALLAAFTAPLAAQAAPSVTAAAPEAIRSELTLPVSEATWTSSRFPQTPQGSKQYLSATRTADQSYLKFDGTTALAGKTIVSASLELNTTYSTATSGGLQVFPASSSWSRAALTYATKPVHQDPALNTQLVRSKTGSPVSIPLATTGTVAAGIFSFELRYSQPYVSTTYALAAGKAPVLKLVVEESPATVPEPLPPVTDPGESAPSSDKKVFAHYFPPYPISIDNQPADNDYYTKNYLKASGENSLFADVGGLLRDRPLPRAPIAASDWEVEDLKTEVSQASDAGIDGFTLDLMSISGRNWDASVNLMKAADELDNGFTVVPNLDVTASVANESIPAIAAKLAELYSYDSAYQVDGAYALSSFRAEAKTPEWWQSLISTLQTSYGIRIAFIAVFLNASDANLAAFAPFSYALSVWGTRTVSTVNAAPNYAEKAHKLGVKWMSPVAVQDVRPRSLLYDESGNTETLRAMWDRAQRDDADLVQLVTWNDYSESTQFAPSVANQGVFLDINEYYLDRFKLVNPPTIGRDALFLTHRIQAADAVPLTVHRLMQPTLSGKSTPPRDTVEVLSMLTAPATITIAVGASKYSFAAPAGVSAVTVPLGLGTVSASASRSGASIVQVTSPFPVVAHPLVQDLQYYASRS